MVSISCAGAAINVLARQAGARVVVIDAGVAAPLAPADGLIDGKVAPGTADISLGPAMTPAQAHQALTLGVRVAQEEIARGLDLLACGEMGIGNTTPATAIIATFTGAPRWKSPARHRCCVAGCAPQGRCDCRSLAVNRPDPADGLDVLTKVGGFEIGAMAGAMLAAAAARVPVVVDGLIATSAALIAAPLAPAVRDS